MKEKLEENNKNILKKIFSSNKLKIYNILIILISIAVFEFGYCNHTFTEKIMQGEVTTFYFSLCRGVVYAVIILLVIILNKKIDFNQIEKTYDNKIKRNVILIYIILALCIIAKIAFNAIISEGTTILMPQLSMVLLAIIGGFTVVIYVSTNYTVNIISMLILTSVLSFTCTTYNVLDEKKHFMESYNISYGNLDFQNPVVDKQFMQDIARGTHYTAMADYFKVPYDFEEGKIPEDDVNDSTPTGSNPILYIPSAIGITIARLLHGSVADVFLLGRLMNLVTYAILIIIALKILPYKKNVFFVIAATPMLVCLAGTYSPDGLGMAVISLFIAYCLKLYDKKDDINIKEISILILLYCLTLTFKSMSYFAIGFLIFILPIKKIIKNNKKKILVIISIIIIALLLILLLQPKMDLAQSSDERGGNTDAISQLQNLINHPALIFEVAYNHITQTLLNFDWLKDLNFKHYFSDISTRVFLCMIILYFYVAIKDDSINFSKKNKSIFITTFLLIYAITSAALYLTFTPVGSNVLRGYQARYIFPIIFLILISISNNSIKNLENKENTIIKTTFISNLFIIVSVIGAIFKW